MTNPLTEARRSLNSSGGALRCALPRNRSALSTIPAVGKPSSSKGPKARFRS